ncbi:MAG: hypothetical protein COT88_00305 [Candidatus Colwellbacteria bacterium CG10_big_fil_rev_8_21_14_0_10_41_28]|uniref:Uncharacterized protein n=1 Tax=Candidatus Colwellbacteria bacterium CG10_big_fil_rev_8_21_14_0_10_41_28 TaxID=1974539 RepID=A0A2H0VHW8_9BACT|nr:MAG: hypothetical protein COT88_00305 [Candidatus Colwellbacteria bacterium CG10_big_fil_rev_8_21_14_0_10_41_28]
MFDFLGPVDAISAITLLVVAGFGLFKLIQIYTHKIYLGNKDYVVLRLNPISLGKSVDSFIKSIKPPFSFEVSIHQLGKDVSYYLVVPRKRVKELIDTPGVEEAHEYSVFYSTGQHVGAYIKGIETWPDVDLDRIDFSKVNEVGEGVTIQFLVNKRTRKGNLANLRIAVSAPSSFQANEIMASLKNSFLKYKVVETSSMEFLREVSLREFSEKEGMSWQY